MKKLKWSLLLAISVLLLTTGCSDDDDPIEPGNDTELAKLQKKSLETIAKRIIKTYKDLSEEAEEFKTAAESFLNSQTQENLDKMKEEWVESRVHWEQSEAFLYGPAAYNNVDPNIDSWPLGVAQLDAILASKDAITPDYLRPLGGKLKGFHTVEYLIWGDATGSKPAKPLADFTAREREFLAGATTLLKEDVDLLYSGWTTAEGKRAPFGDLLMTAGETGNTTFASREDAFEQLVGGIIDIAVEVADTKIAESFGTNAATVSYEDEESRFSHNSKKDFTNNIVSIENVYEAGLKAVLNHFDKKLADRISVEIKEAQTALMNIGGSPDATYTDALTQDRNSIQAAFDAVKKIEASFISAKPLVGKGEK